MAAKFGNGTWDAEFQPDGSLKLVQWRIPEPRHRSDRPLQTIIVPADTIKQAEPAARVSAATKAPEIDG